MIIREKAFARAGLIGNPSDGYFGKTISVILKNFYAEIILFESPELRIEPNPRDQSVFASIDQMVADVQISGYYGGMRLIKATIKKFHEYATTHHLPLLPRNFTIRYDSNIPMRVGMAGSSAIITATMRALCRFYEIEIPKPYLPTLILRVETEELGIAAGLQDRVIQVYGGCVYMDFERDYVEENQFGRYEEVDVNLLPPLYVAYQHKLAEGTEVVHNDLRERWNRGDQDVREGMKKFVGLTDSFYRALKAGDVPEMSRLINANFDLRASLVKISRENWAMINAARNAGASAHFCGSGGAIIGIYEGERMFEEVERAMKEIGAKVIKPKL